MKKFATLVFATAALSASAMATTFTSNCVAFPTQFNGGVGSGSVSCAAFGGAPAGEILSGASLAFFSDFTFGSAATNTVRFTYTLGAPAGVTWATGSFIQDVTGGFSSSSSSPAAGTMVAATAGITAANFASAFNVGLASSIITGGVGTSSGGVQVTYTTTSLTPEPGTTALLGSGLMALAYLGRKRFGR